jgi:hypothetical protein
MVATPLEGGATDDGRLAFESYWDLAEWKP